MVWNYYLDGKYSQDNPRKIAEDFTPGFPELIPDIIAELRVMKPGETREICGIEVTCEIGYLLEDGNSYMCAAYTTPRTFEWCVENCARYYGCDTVAWALDESKANECEE